VVDFFDDVIKKIETFFTDLTTKTFVDIKSGVDKFISDIVSSVMKPIDDLVRWVDEKVQSILSWFRKVEASVPRVRLPRAGWFSGFHFQHGGIVPGPPTRAVPAILHGGEMVIPRGKLPTLTYSPVFNINISTSGSIDVDTLIEEIRRRDIDTLRRKLLR